MTSRWLTALAVTVAALAVVSTTAPASADTARAGVVPAVETYDGYALFDGLAANAYTYTVKLVASPRAEKYRATLQDVASELKTAGTAQLSIASGTFPAPSGDPAAHEIYVYTLPSSPCGAGEAGCGGPIPAARADSSTALAIAGDVWIYPVVDGYSAADKRHVVAHEIGHALGLQHYTSAYQGATQVMHPSSYASSRYQSGDRAGLSFVGRDVRPTGAVESFTTPSSGKVRVKGWAYDPDQWGAATVRVTVDGARAAQFTTNISRPDVDRSKGLRSANRGYDVTVAVAGGAHRVCVAALDYPRTSFVQTGDCRWVTSKGIVATSRIQGADRYQTAVAVSKAAFARTAPVVVIASGENFPDALAAGPVARKLGGPLLLTQTDALPASTRAEIARLKPGRIVVAGGPNAVSDAVVSSLGSLATAVQRVGGVDRYDTARRLAATAFTSSATAYVASGANFPDGLSAGAAAASLNAPLLLVAAQPGPADSAAVAQLRALKVASVRVAGGPAAVSDATLAKIRSSFPITTRVSGADRYLTAVAISKNAYTAQTTRALIANGTNFPDGLVAAPLAASTKSPLFLATSGCVRREVMTEMNRLGATNLTLIGGTSVLGPGVGGLAPC